VEGVRSRLQQTVLVALTAGLLAPVALASIRLAAASFRGRTSQGIAIRLGPHRSYGRAFRYRAWMRCADGTTFLDRYFIDDVSVRRGQFSSRVSSSGGAVLTHVTGTLRGTRAYGTIRIIERYSEIPDPQGNTPLSADGAIVCDSHMVRWHATARR
jgi:hypothetical protein